jgi:transposase-like protein
MFKSRHFDRSVILLCVRWYLAYGLTLRDLEEMMAERGSAVDHATIHRWTVHCAPLLLEQFNRRKRAVTGMWHVDETYQSPWSMAVPLPRDRQQRRHG